MGEKDDFDLGIMIEKVNNVQSEQKEQKVQIEKLKDQVNELKNNDDKTKIYVTQIFEMLNEIKGSLEQIKKEREQQAEHKSRKVSETVKQIIYIAITGVLTAVSTYYGTLASFTHQIK